MKKEKAQDMLKNLNGWELVENAGKIEKKYKFANFVEAMAFINKVAEIAEQEGHHPDIFVSYSRVTITLFTHKINGLHMNDFIVAAKIDALEKNGA